MKLDLALSCLFPGRKVRHCSVLSACRMSGKTLHYLDYIQNVRLYIVLFCLYPECKARPYTTVLSVSRTTARPCTVFLYSGCKSRPSTV